MLGPKEFELLLPWYLTGTLSDSERALVTAYLQAHPEEDGRLQWDTSMRSAIEKQASELPEDLGLDRALSTVRGGKDIRRLETRLREKTLKVDRYAVVGNPVGNSLAPEIHQLFAQATRQQISYERLQGPLDGFEEFALGLRDSGYLGLNVTIPFKLDAAKLADSLTARARAAGAVNTLKFEEDTIYGHNTDGIGFVRDITHRLAFKVSNAAILVLGAGGGERGLIAALLEELPKWIAVANRAHGRAQELADEFGVEAIRLDEIPAEHFDLIVNGTASNLNQDAPPIDSETFDDCPLAYDLMYAPAATPFMRLAQRGGAHTVADGLGMLIEQAAESFLFWRGVRPDTAPVYRELRRILEQSRTSTAT